MALDEVISNINNVKTRNKQLGPMLPATPNLPNNMKYGEGLDIENFPIHLYPPRGASTFDIRKSVGLTLTLPLVYSAVLIDWTIPQDKVVIWNGYSLFSDCAAGVTAEWTLTVDGNPVFPYHGDSLNGFKKTLALSTDLSNLIYSLIELRGGQRIVVTGSVDSLPTSCTISARIVGWTISKKIQVMGGAG
jgi:hypothetical protein